MKQKEKKNRKIKASPQAQCERIVPSWTLESIRPTKKTERRKRE